MNRKMFLLIGVVLAAILLATLVIHLYASSAYQPVNIKSVLSHDNVDTIVGKTDTVSITGTSFSPTLLSINPNDSVTWQNSTLQTQELVFIDGIVGTINPSGTYKRAFPTPGDYSYHLKSDPQVQGQIRVTNPNGTQSKSGG